MFACPPGGQSDVHLVSLGAGFGSYSGDTNEGRLSYQQSPSLVYFLRRTVLSHFPTSEYMVSRHKMSTFSRSTLTSHRLAFSPTGPLYRTPAGRQFMFPIPSSPLVNAYSILPPSIHTKRHIFIFAPSNDSIIRGTTPTRHHAELDKTLVLVQPRLLCLPLPLSLALLALLRRRETAHTSRRTHSHSHSHPHPHTWPCRARLPIQVAVHRSTHHTRPRLSWRWWQAKPREPRRRTHRRTAIQSRAPARWRRQREGVL